MAEDEGFEPSPHFRVAGLATQCDATYFTDLPFIWRKERDSNPQTPSLGSNGFQGRAVRQYCSPSFFGGNGRI